MHYGILGTTTAHHDDGTAIPLGGARLRALLAALALRQGRPVPADLLAEEVWGAEPPQDAAAALQTLVGRLRRTVGRGEIGSGPAGYWLTRPDTDLAEFQRLSAEGRRAMEAADHAVAAERLREALALWRGAALADLPDLGGPAIRLEAQREETRRHRISADLALGRAAELTAELAGLAEQHPLDEQVQYLLIRALHDSGRSSEALRQYERVRRVLADELGTDPGRQLRALHGELLRPADPSPEPAGGPGRPGRGLDGAHPPMNGDLWAPSAAPAPTPPAPTPPASHAAPAPQALTARPTPGPAAQPPAPAARTAGNLRARLTSFVGRESDLAAVRAALTAGRLTTLTGPGGSGKTRLSVEAGRAELAAGNWPDGVWLAELAPLESPEAVPGAVFSALGLRETVLHTGNKVVEVIENRTDDPVRRIVEHCGRRRMLIVLDNCEHLIQAAADLADRLLAECPGLTVLATSREPLGVPGEAVLPVEPLPDPVALRLLAERAAAGRPGFDPDADPEACAEICRRLDGLPLAIELAAARLRVMTPRQIADRLDGRFALLTAGSRTLLPRQQTLRAVVDWSWDLLGKRERAVLRRLSAFAGGWTLEDAEAVCSDAAGVPREDVADLLLSLVDKSLVVAGLDAEGPPRYWMLETIHEYAAERLAQTPEDDVQLRHLRHFRDVLRATEPDRYGPRQLGLISLLEREKDNVRVALRRAVDRGEEQDALVIALGMSWFWTLRGYSAEAHSWYDAVAQLGPDPFADGAPPAEPLAADILHCPLPMTPDVLAEARRQLRLSRLVSQFEGDMEVLDNVEAADLARRIIRTYTPDLPQSYKFPALMRVFAAFLAGKLDQMREMLDDAVAGCRVHGSDSDLAFILQIRAKMMNDWPGGLEAGIRDGDESLALFTRAGDRWGMSQALAARAESLTTAGETEQAVVAYRQAIELTQEVGAPQEVPMLMVQLGNALMGSDPAEGERIVREALEQVGDGTHGSNGAVLFGRLVLTGLHTLREEFTEALQELDVLEQAQGEYGPLVPGLVPSLLSCIRGWVTARSGEPERGLLLLIGGWSLLRGMKSEVGAFAEQMTVLLVPAAAGVLRVFAERDQDLDCARQAARLLGSHAGLNGPKGGFLDQVEARTADRSLRRLLGDDGYEAAIAQGGGLSLGGTTAVLDSLGDWARERGLEL
ncbi:winged helix-turn-helix domain-containing protein [Kitasatospora sp. NBC_00240]|uniref:AfsR/SARP family transcriptional regulator n=1 Tax=Kitasatospora sp. NBC_00240 TaxID=2903567 RepID=UPI0022514DBF|nr:BTAD domain-containing putative transcriptional regulator [Kitasatospora sp. NBC_00240]MCX5213262.1 winged helix-turn-helix domain-containing protein [Kitasatospora sp. NBC_00240]